MKNFAIFCLGTLLAASVSNASGASGQLGPLSTGLVERIDAQIEQHIEAGTVPGASVVLVAQGEIQHARGFGYATLPDQPATAETVFSLGSVSKNFVGLAINRLADSGKLDLGDEVARYIPELKIENPFGTPLTVRHLLNHSSGLSAYTGNRNQDEVAIDESSLADSLRELADSPLQSEPGRLFEYSNANYQILGVVIERLTGSSFPNAMRSLVFEPLQLKHSAIGHDFARPNTATGYRFWLKSPRPYRKGLGSALEPQGGVSSTALDMGRYLIACTGGNETTPNIYQSLWAEAHATSTENLGYGPGWFVLERPAGPLLYHHGLNPGFSAAMAFDPATGVGVAVLANASDGFVAGDVTNLMESVLAEVFPELSVARVDATSRWIQILLLAVLLLGLVVWVIWFLRAQPKRRPTYLRMFLPTVLLLGFAGVVGLWLPPVLQIPLVGITMFSPDIGWLLLALVWSAAGWAVARLLLMFWHRHSSEKVDAP